MADKKLILLVLDGFGLSPAVQGNATYRAQTPNFDKIFAEYPYTALLAHGAEVGLQWGEMGNSEVGHTNLGAGRVVLQESTRITESIRTGEFFENEALVNAAEKVKQNDATLHCIGIVSPGGVHGHIEHLISLIEFAGKQGLKKVALHLISDGRDATPKSFEKFFPKLEAMANKNGAKCATLMGRYYAMDRDRRWDRVKAAYDAMVKGDGHKAKNVPEALKAAYGRDETDEFIAPTVIDPDNQDLRVKDGDVVIFTNYRPDRARQLSLALDGKDFQGFEVDQKDISFVTFSEYGIELKNNEVAFPEPPIPDTLAETLSLAGKRQLHLAETEKYAHVTYFFNGGREEEFSGEKRMLVNSKHVKTYDKAPGMSAIEIGDTLLDTYRNDGFDVAIVNFANGDMVGHTGNLKRSIEGIEVLDGVIGKIFNEVVERDDILMITADHGNVEQLIHPDTGDIDKEHTANPVPLILIDSHYKHSPLSGDVKMKIMSQAPVGILADVAPTLLELLKIRKPRLMTGHSLIPVLKQYR